MDPKKLIPIAILLALIGYSMTGKAASKKKVVQPIPTDEPDDTDDPPAVKPKKDPPPPPAKSPFPPYQELWNLPEEENARAISQNRPQNYTTSDGEARSREKNQTASSWLTNVAYWTTYPMVPAKFPQGWAQMANAQDYIDAWERINVMVKKELEDWKSKIWHNAGCTQMAVGPSFKTYVLDSWLLNWKIAGKGLDSDVAVRDLLNDHVPKCAVANTAAYRKVVSNFKKRAQSKFGFA